MVLYSSLYRLAGTTDKPCFRTISNKSILDIFDYKTDEEIKYKSDYSDYMLGPLSHLENCNFNKHAMQLSEYALMAEEQGFKIGRLGIIHISKLAMDKPVLIPVNYMKAEAQAIIKYAPELLQSLYGQPERKQTAAIAAVVDDDDF